MTLEQQLQDTIVKERRRHRDTIADALMLAICGGITPDELFDRVNVAHDEACKAYVRLGAKSTDVIVAV